MSNGNTKTVIPVSELKLYIDRIERLLAEKDAISADIKEIYDEAGGKGFCTRTMRRVIRERKADEAKRQEDQDMFEIYWGALEGSPLAEAAKQKAA